MEERILEFFQDVYDEEVENYLQEYCETEEDLESYGDTTVTSGYDYSDDDQMEAESYAMERMEESLNKALYQLKKKEGFIRDEKDVKALAEKAKAVVEGL